MTAKLTNREWMKQHHDKLRAQGICISNPAHGKAHRGGRCRACWNKKLTAERVAWAARHKR